MSKNYLIDYIDGITRIKFLHKPTYDEAKMAIDDIAENFPYDKRLWNISNIHFNFTIGEIMSIAEYGKTKFTKPNKIALVASDDLAYGEMRQFEVYREQENHSETKVFRGEQEAIEWLNK